MNEKFTGGLQAEGLCLPEARHLPNLAFAGRGVGGGTACRAPTESRRQLWSVAKRTSPLLEWCYGSVRCALRIRPIECRLAVQAYPAAPESCSLPKEKLAAGADHAGFRLKEYVRHYLGEQGYQVEDCGAFSVEPSDYPDYAEKVARMVASGEAAWGVLICGTGLGVAIAANKVPGIRAATCDNTLLARFAREHNQANILAMGGRIVDRATARKILHTWISTGFAGGRHARRVEKIAALELKEKSS